MIVGAAPCRIAEHEHRSLFFPWGGFFTLGSVWAYEVSPDESLDELLRQVRRYQFATLFFMVIAISLGAWLNMVRPCLAAGILVPMFVYSMLILRRMKSLARVPVQESLAIFAVEVGAEFLWQNVLLGVLYAVCSVWLSFANVGLIISTVALVINSLIALYALRTIPD